jgi:hypothetical protein
LEKDDLGDWRSCGSHWREWETEPELWGWQGEAGSGDYFIGRMSSLGTRLDGVRIWYWPGLLQSTIDQEEDPERGANLGDWIEIQSDLMSVWVHPKFEAMGLWSCLYCWWQETKDFTKIMKMFHQKQTSSKGLL